MYISHDPRIATYQKKIMYWHMSCEDLLREIEKAEVWLEANKEHKAIGVARERYEMMTKEYDSKLEATQNVKETLF